MARVTWPENTVLCDPNWRINASLNCVKMQCTRHSLALWVLKGFEKLSSNLGFMLPEIPKWFNCLRKVLSDVNNMNLFETMWTQQMNLADESTPAVPLPFLKMSPNLWLVRGKVIFNILKLTKLGELKHFSLVTAAKDKITPSYESQNAWVQFKNPHHCHNGLY